MALQPRNLTILATLVLAGCGAMPNLSLPATNDFKGKPLSAVIARFGSPDFQRTVAGQKMYTWRIGTAIQECNIRVVMAGDIVESYETSGEPIACSPYLGPAPPFIQ
jgi:hypothetical protein